MARHWLFGIESILIRVDFCFDIFGVEAILIQGGFFFKRIKICLNDVHLPSNCDCDHTSALRGKYAIQERSERLLRACIAPEMAIKSKVKAA